jgi:nitroreductase
MTTFSELLEKRRSIRKFSDKPVDVETIKEIIKESTLAPSSGNGQPWKFIIVNDKQVIKRMSDESKKNILAEIAENPAHRSLKYKGALEKDGFNVFYDAPCLVIILGLAAEKSAYVDCSLLASYFMMSAVNCGMGTCWINLGANIKDPGLIAELGIPEDCNIVAPMIIGHTENIPKAPARVEPEILKIIDDSN